MGVARKLTPEELAGAVAEQPPDRVAPYGLSGVVRGDRAPQSRKLTPEELAGAQPVEAPGAAKSFALGAVQGGTLGAGGALQAAIETAASKVPLLRDALQAVNVGGATDISNPNLTYEQRRAAYADRNAGARAANPKAFLAGEIAGGIATPVPGVGAAGGAVGNVVGRAIGATAGKVAAGAVKGAISGAAYGAGSGLSEGHSAAQLVTDAEHGAVGGAVIGGGASALGAGIRKYAAGATKRLAARLDADVITGDTNASKRVGDKVRAMAGEDNQRLSSVLDELPDVKKTVALSAKSNPGKAEKVARGAVDKMTAENDGVFEAIQGQHGGVNLGSLVTSIAKQVTKARSSGKAISEDAAEAVRKDLLKRFGYEGKWTPEMKLTAEQVRNYRNDLGDVAFAGASPSMAANKKRTALADVYRAFSEGIEEVASKTEGVNLAAFKARNRRISTLIPVIDALSERAAKESGGGKLKAVAKGALGLAFPAAGLGFGGGSVEGALLGAGAYVGGRAVGHAARAIDYSIASGKLPSPMQAVVDRLGKAAATNPRAAALLKALLERTGQNAATAVAAPLGGVTSSTLGASP